MFNATIKQDIAGGIVSDGFNFYRCIVYKIEVWYRRVTVEKSGRQKASELTEPH